MVQPKTVDDVRCHSSANTVACFQDQDPLTCFTQKRSASQSGKSRSYNDDFWFRCSFQSDSSQIAADSNDFEASVRQFLRQCLLRLILSVDQTDLCRTFLHVFDKLNQIGLISVR